MSMDATLMTWLAMTRIVGLDTEARLMADAEGGE